jgi:hypothetical protein
VKITSASSLRDVAFVVCTALDVGGVQTVLTGGSAATVYAPRAYQSRDLDFIITFHAHHVRAEEILTTLGYSEAHGHYEHTDNELILEFPKGPLAIGRDLVETWDTLRRRGMLLHIITATDSCRDRLAGFLFWNDRSSLDQAVAVARARRTDVDMKRIRAWCHAEGKDDAFSEFQRALSTA